LVSGKISLKKSKIGWQPPAPGFKSTQTIVMPTSPHPYQKKVVLPPALPSTNLSLQSLPKNLLATPKAASE
ncbi:MAG: hypothetical protein ACO35B_12055, partial [Luminiphilus sp.]